MQCIFWRKSYQIKMANYNNKIVVVVNEKFGIRLTDVISQAERIKQLGED